mmetsp:Transcript_6751/g.23733  ORF Transcript_6751/g.23733 Transcript_6751/m.23733 type:complete len:139 (+) Transcript_6751:880-1296(+)
MLQSRQRRRRTCTKVHGSSVLKWPPSWLGDWPELQGCKICNEFLEPSELAHDVQAASQYALKLLESKTKQEIEAIKVLGFDVLTNTEPDILVEAEKLTFSPVPTNVYSFNFSFIFINLLSLHSLHEALLDNKCTVLTM